MNIPPDLQLSPGERLILQELKLIKNQLNAVAPATLWLTVIEACSEFGTSRETLRKLELRDAIEAGAALPKVYSRRSLNLHFHGYV